MSNKTMKRLQVVLTAICFSICGMASEIVNDFYGLPVYKVDSFVYAFLVDDKNYFLSVIRLIFN